MFLPTEGAEGATLVIRQYPYEPYYGNNNWYNWGRWVFLGVIIVFFIILFFLVSCFSARRRRQRGAQPYAGTGWLAPGHGPVNYYPGQQETQQPYPPQGYYSQQPAPPYGAPYGQENGVELQPPNNTYQPQSGGNYVYGQRGGPESNKRDVVA